MFSLIDHIEYLMTRNDCVVIPGWGALVAHYQPSSSDEQAGWLVRPQREIGFNASVQHNDGLLAQSLMRREGLSYADAMRCIDDSVSGMRRQLAQGIDVSMGRLGYLRHTQDGHTEYVSYDHQQPSDEYYGLGNVPIKTLDALALEREQAREQAVAAFTEHTTQVDTHRSWLSGRVARLAASVAVLIGLGVLLTTPVLVDRSHRDMASVVPTVSAPQVQQLTTVQSAEPTIEGVGNTAGKYYLVIASLRNQQELQAFKAANPELVSSMRTLTYRGLTCVYVARSDSYSTLMGLRDQLPEHLRNVWIYSN